MLSVILMPFKFYYKKKMPGRWLQWMTNFPFLPWGHKHNNRTDYAPLWEIQKPRGSSAYITEVTSKLVEYLLDCHSVLTTYYSVAPEHSTRRNSAHSFFLERKRLRMHSVFSFLWVLFERLRILHSLSQNIGEARTDFPYLRIIKNKT